VASAYFDADGQIAPTPVSFTGAKGFGMLRLVLMSILLVMLFAAGARAQLANQTALVGTVTDASTAVIPGATVVALNVNVGTQDRHVARA
jgi:hypothetical protein